MSQTYRAIIRGNQIEWTGEVPQVGSAQEGLRVHVIVDDVPQEPTAEAKRRMMEAFERLAQASTFADVDPVEWQREQRRDRPLPGRE
jgi:hypothetical protein